jgi:hypothetical protein
MTIPLHIIEILRQRKNLDSNNNSKDEQILKMQPAAMVRECVAWELGYPSWADYFAKLMKDCNSKLEDF